MNRIARYILERLDALESGLCAVWTHERRAAAYLAYLDALGQVLRPGETQAYPWHHADTPSMADLVALRASTVSRPLHPGSAEDFNAFMRATFPDVVPEGAEFHVDAGWRQILVDLAQSLRPGELLGYAKAKYARLDGIALDDEDPRVQRAIAASCRTCETCGLPGRHTETRIGWEVIACPLHDEQDQAE